MPASTTPLLLLGAVALFEPVNGYQIRRELVSWQVEQWANVRTGSIYHALAKLAESGDLSRHDLADGPREVAVYQITEAGRARLITLVEAAITEVNVYDRRAFQAAFGLLPAVGNARALTLLEQRLTRLTAECQAQVIDPAEYPYAPPHALRGAQMWAEMTRAELAWLAGVVEDLRSGHLTFDPAQGWAPPADDPGHQMTSDRNRYRELIAKQATTSE